MNEADAIVKEMVIDSAAGYDLLKLPNGSYAAFWKQGYGMDDYSGSIARGEYHTPPLAYIGDALSVVRFIKEELDCFNNTDPNGFGKLALKPNGYLAKTLRTYK